VNINIVDPPGPLHLLARHPESHNVLGLLIDLGADLEQKDQVGVPVIAAVVDVGGGGGGQTYKCSTAKR